MRTEFFQGVEESGGIGEGCFQGLGKADKKIPRLGKSDSKISKHWKAQAGNPAVSAARSGRF